jgi:hypothetical protein
LAKPNYRHAKKQKEAARKARQDAKQQRRAVGPESAGEVSAQPDLPAESIPVKPGE